MWHTLYGIRPISNIGHVFFHLNRLKYIFFPINHICCLAAQVFFDIDSYVTATSLILYTWSRVPPRQSYVVHDLLTTPNFLCAESNLLDSGLAYYICYSLRRTYEIVMNVFLLILIKLKDTWLTCLTLYLILLELIHLHARKCPSPSSSVLVFIILYPHV